MFVVQLVDKLEQQIEKLLRVAKPVLPHIGKLWTFVNLNDITTE